MDLLSIAKILAPLAPVAASIAGGIVAGPAGAAVAGKLASLIMGKFGLAGDATSAQLNERIIEAGEETARAKINAAMEQARAEIAGFVEIERIAADLMAKSLAETNATMRAESADRVRLAAQGIREHWFFTAWRPAAGWVFNFVMTLFGVALAYAILVTIKTADDPLKELREAWPLFAAYIGALAAVVGVYIPSRSFEKKAAIENAAPMPNAKPVVVVPPVAKPSPVLPKPAIGKPAGSRD